MKPSGVLINIARGGVVDEDALIAALRAGKIRGAGLDVFKTEPLPKASPLWDMPNVFITSHVGGMADTYGEQVMPLLVENLRAFTARTAGARAFHCEAIGRACVCLRSNASNSPPPCKSSSAAGPRCARRWRRATSTR